MPEPLLYLKAMGVAAIVSSTFVLVVAGMRHPASAMRMNLACLLAMGVGLALGYYVLSLQLAWPPSSGLDRLLTIVLPAAFLIELIAGIECVPRSVAWPLRISLAALIPRILLHGSVYLSGSESDWPLWQGYVALVACSAMLGGVWALLSCLSERSPGVSIPFVLCLTAQCAGLTVMMAGYIKGGAAAFPLTATLVATTIAFRLIVKSSSEPTGAGTSAILGVGVVGLFGLLLIGRFFGRLSTSDALIMWFAPLLCWATEMPVLRHRKPWLAGALRLMLVAIPLAVVLGMAKRDFDRDMAPLLGTWQATNLHQPEIRHHGTQDYQPLVIRPSAR